MARAMEHSERVLGGLLLPMQGFHVLLPQSAVAEIVQDSEVSQFVKSMDWVRGTLTWRSERLPLISLETMCGKSKTHNTQKSRIAIIYALEGIANLRFYAIELEGVPRPVTLDVHAVTYTENSRDPCDYLLANVLVTDQKGIIPDLARIERKVAERIQEFS